MSDQDNVPVWPQNVPRREGESLDDWIDRYERDVQTASEKFFDDCFCKYVLGHPSAPALPAAIPSDTPIARIAICETLEVLKGDLDYHYAELGERKTATLDRSGDLIIEGAVIGNLKDSFKELDFAVPTDFWNWSWALLSSGSAPHLFFGVKAEKNDDASVTLTRIENQSQTKLWKQDYTAEITRRAETAAAEAARLAKIDQAAEQTKQALGAPPAKFRLKP